MNIIIKAIEAFHEKLILMEHYCAMNYIGLVKILKKHDKLTGFDTKQAFISKVVNTKSFASYKALLELMNNIQSLFMKIKSQYSISSDV